HFTAADYNGTPMVRRAMTNTSMSSPSVIQQKRSAPRIVSSLTHIRPHGTRLKSGASSLLIQKHQANAVSSAPLIYGQ
ncbi:hypothetical protein Angca_000880, partial [Angiostrongylus cantonensis]